MKIYLVFLLSVLQVTLSAKIYDCFTFFNEMELLKVRFEELYDSVDHFVLVEATQSFCGDSKPLHFSENAEQFIQYKDKIIHVIVDDFPAPTTDLENDRWVREKFQRNAILRGLIECHNEDIIMISDLDEIPNQRSINEIRNFFKRQDYSKKSNLKRIVGANIKPENRFVCELHMRLFLFHLNSESLEGWNGAVKAAPYWLVSKLSPWDLKILHLYDRNLFKIYNAGCHFHSMGGYERILNKLLSIYRYDNKSFIKPDIFRTLSPSLASRKRSESTVTWPESIEIANNPDLFIKWSKEIFGFTLVPFDDSYPKYILENLDYFHAIGWIAE